MAPTVRMVPLQVPPSVRTLHPAGHATLEEDLEEELEEELEDEETEEVEETEETEEGQSQRA